jgi:tellurite resistance-related uncharacterized protein
MKEETKQIIEAGFDAFKKEILRRAGAAGFGEDEYRRLLRSNDYSGLMQVIKDNFSFAACHKIIDASLIESREEQFQSNQIYCNQSVDGGFLLACGQAGVDACGQARAIVLDHAKVYAYGQAMVEARGHAEVDACGHAVVEARGHAIIAADNQAIVIAREHAKVDAWGHAVVIAGESAMIEAWGEARVIACGNARIEAWEDSCIISGEAVARVEAREDSCIISGEAVECKLHDNAIRRICKTGN